MNAILLTLLGFFPPPGVFGEPVAVAPLVQTRDVTLVVVAPPEVPVVWPGARRVATRGLPMLGDLSGPGGTLRIYEGGVLPGVPTSVATDGAAVVVVGGALGDFFGRRIDPGGVVRRMRPPKGLRRLWAGLAGDRETLLLYAITESRFDRDAKRLVWPITVERVQRYGGLQTEFRPDLALAEPVQICASDEALWTVGLEAATDRAVLAPWSYGLLSAELIERRREALMDAVAAGPPIVRGGCATQVGPLGPVVRVIEGAGPRAVRRSGPDLPAYSAERGMTRAPFPAEAPPGVRFDAALLGFPGLDRLIPAVADIPGGVPDEDGGPWTAETMDAAEGPVGALDGGAERAVGALDTAAEHL